MSKQPTHRIYSVRDVEREGESQAQWNQVGVAWAHKDGNGLDLVLHQLPMVFFTDGRLTVRRIREEARQE